MAPADEAELIHMVKTAAEYDEGPIAFDTEGRSWGRFAEPGSVDIGKGRIINNGSVIFVLALA